MKERLAYFLKHNPCAQKLYKTIMSFVFRVLGRFVRTDPELVLFVSFMGKKCADSPKVIYDYMQAHPQFSRFRCVWGLEHPKDHPGLSTVTIDTPAYFLTALRAKYWVTNTNIERGLTFKKPDQIYLNTWHGVALKYIGNDCPGRQDYNFDTVNHLCVSGDHDERVFRTAFRAHSERYLRCGMPRNDQLWSATEEDRVRARELLGIPDGKQVIVYAPTWRESVDGGKGYDIAPPIDFKLWKQQLGETYVLLFRAHHLTTNILNVTFDDFVRDFSDYPEVNDLLLAADLLITDYSAIAFDYAILGRPILTFAYDYDTYLKERGTYFDMDEVYPSPSCRTQEELLERICNLDPAAEAEKTLRFRDRFIRYGKSAAEQCTAALFGSHDTETV